MTPTGTHTMRHVYHNTIRTRDRLKTGAGRRMATRPRFRPAAFFGFLLIALTLYPETGEAAPVRVRRDRDQILEIDNGLVRLAFDPERNHSLTGLYYRASGQPLVLRMAAHCGDGQFVARQKWCEDVSGQRLASRQISARVIGGDREAALEVVTANEAFMWRRLISCSAGSPLVRVRYEQTFKRPCDTFSGGIEIDFAASLNAFCSPRGDGTFQTERDVAAAYGMCTRRWFARDWYAAFSPVTKEGVLVLIPDKQPWEYFLSPQITREGAGRHRMSLSHPRLMFEKHVAGETVRGDFCLMPYQGNPVEVGPSVYAGLAASVVTPPSAPLSARRLPGPPGVALWSELPSRKVFREDPVAPSLPEGKGLEIRAARNEYEAVQLVIAPSADVERARLEFSDLKGPGVIDVKNIRARPVGYVNCREFSGPYYSFWARAGWNPDPLLASETVAAPKNRNTPFWITVRVPADAPAGDYEGIVTLRLDELPPVATPLRLHVYGFTLPETPSLQIYAHYRQPAGLSRETMLRNLLDHRVRWIDFADTSLAGRWGPDGHLIPGFDAAAFEQTRSWLIQHPDVRFTFQEWKIGGNQLDLDGLSDRFLKPYYDNLRQGLAFFKAGGVAEERIFLYPWDEPFDDLPLLRRLKTFYDRIRPFAPRAKIMLTHEPNPAEGLCGQVDIWAPNINWYRRGQRWCAERQVCGDRVWTYNNCLYMVDTPAIHARIVGWMLWKHQMDGYLFFHVNSWSRDPWRSPDQEGSGRNGDGCLIYPDPESKGRIADSIRWELLRDGFEEYEYFSLLRERVRQSRRKGACGAVINEAEAALSIHDGLVADLWRFTHDPSKLNAVRENLAGLIERLEGSGEGKTQRQEPNERQRSL